MPDGWAGMKQEAQMAAVVAAKESKEIVKMLIERGHAEEPDDPRVRVAFEAAVEIVTAKHPETDKPLYEARERMSAARLLADFLKAKPASKQDIKVTKAEDFLSLLASESHLAQ